MPEPSPDVICLGELLIDMVSSGADVSLQDAPGFAKAPGGAPANVCVGLQRLGTPSAFISCVGDDPFGEFLRDVLVREGVDTSGLITHEIARTTLAFVATRRDGKKDICFYRNPGADAQLTASSIPNGLFENAKLFHCGSVTLSQSPAREAQLHAANLARERGLLVSYDPNWRPSLWPDHDEARNLIWQMMPLSDIVKLADEEWEFVTGTENFEEGARRVLESGPKLVLQTRGANGSAFFTATTRGEVPGFDVPALDTLGAGDAFMAAMLHQLSQRGLDESLNERTLREMLRFANACGALATTQVGAIPALPTKAEVEAFLASR